MMKVGAIVKTLRQSMGLTQAEFARKCDVSDVFVSLVERGRRLAEIKFGEDFYWRLSHLAAYSEGTRRQLYARLVLEDLRYRYPGVIELCLEEALKDAIRKGKNDDEHPQA